MRRLSAVLVVLVSGLAQAQKADPTLAPIKDDPKLPRVLLIGDSISMGYTLPVRKLLDGKANVHRIPDNGGPTTHGLKNLDTVAYVRFASVYRDFREAKDFETFVGELAEDKASAPKDE